MLIFSQFAPEMGNKRGKGAVVIQRFGKVSVRLRECLRIRRDCALMGEKPGKQRKTTFGQIITLTLTLIIPVRPITLAKYCNLLHNMVMEHELLC